MTDIFIRIIAMLVKDFITMLDAKSVNSDDLTHLRDSLRVEMSKLDDRQAAFEADNWKIVKGE